MRSLLAAETLQAEPARVATSLVEPDPILTNRAITPKLRVAVVSDAIEGRNGVGTYYPDLIAHLREHVDAIELICPRENNDQLENFSIPLPGDPSQRLCWPKVKQLKRSLHKLDPNLIVIPAMGAYSYYAIQYARRQQIPFVLVNHTNFDQLCSLYWRPWIARPISALLNWAYRWGMRRASAVAAMNAESLDNALNHGAEHARVVGTPIPPEFTQTPLRHRTSPISEVCFVGRLAAEKGLDRYLQAAEELPNINFVIVGDGPLRGNIQKAAAQQKNVEYRGWQPRERVLEQIDSSDMLILPSRIETFGTVALEALARRRYVLVGRGCGICKWPSISEGLFYLNDDETLAQAIRNVCNLSSETRDRIAQSSWDAVEKFNRQTTQTWLRLLSDTWQAYYEPEEVGKCNEFPVSMDQPTVEAHA